MLDMKSRVGGDVRKVRVRERELENRLEIARMEKTAFLSEMVSFMTFISISARSRRSTLMRSTR